MCLIMCVWEVQRTKRVELSDPIVVGPPGTAPTCVKKSKEK